MNRSFDLVVIGCGPRGTGYAALATSRWGDRYRVVAAADPRPERVERLRGMASGPFQGFASAEACFAAGRLGDVAVIATQDAFHVEPCLRALELGYDVLLEKPVAPTSEQVLAVQVAADRHGRKVIVCHVLRYAPLWSAVARVVASGRLGRIVHIDHREGVGAWHQVHSYVRGYWARTAEATPMLLAKCCHDLDLIRWFMGRAPCTVASFGALSHFRPERRPPGATARCAGCTLRAGCAYDCGHYTGRQKGWLWSLNADLAEHGTPEQIRAWVEVSPWGRCAWACDNDAVDHQVVAMDWGDATASLTMTAFADGRRMTICGTEGRLHASDAEGLRLVGHHGGEEVIPVATDVYGHGGADAGLVEHLADELRLPRGTQLTGIDVSSDSHGMAFAAEASRHAGGAPVDLAAFIRQHQGSAP